MIQLDAVERGLKGLTRVRVTSWIAVAALTLTACYAALEAYGAFKLANMSVEGLSFIMTVEEIYPLVLLTTVIAFVTWSFHAHANLAYLGRENPNHVNQATIWWWIVPMANLWMPFRVLFETGRGSMAPIDDEEWKRYPVPKSAIWWTVLMLAGLFAVNIGSSVLDSATSIDALEGAFVLNGVAFIIYGAGAVSGMVMIIQYTGGQADATLALARRQVMGQLPVPTVSEPAAAEVDHVSDPVVPFLPEASGSVPPVSPPDSADHPVPAPRKGLPRWVVWVGSALLMLTLATVGLFGWHGWTWRQILDRTAYVDDPEMWQPYFEVMACDLRRAEANGDTLSSWVFFDGLRANKTIQARLEERVASLNGVAITPWQSTTRSAVDTINVHYRAWEQYLDRENAVMLDVLAGEIESYQDFYQVLLVSDSDISPTFWAAKDAYFLAAPFWIEAEAIEAAFLDSGEEMQLSCG